MSDITITVKQARKLPKADVEGTIDPYFILKYGDAKKKTTKKKNNQNPVYNEEIGFTYNAATGTEILVELWDYDGLTKDDFVAQGKLDFSKNNNTIKWYPLTHVGGGVENAVKGSPAGEVELEVVYTVVIFGGPAPVVKTRSFGQPTALPIIFAGNADAWPKVQYLSATKLRNTLPLGPSCSPFSFILDTELVGGIYKVVLVSQLDAPAWGRWAGLYQGTTGLRQFHIVQNNGVDHNSGQLSVLGVKTGGDWAYKIPNYIEPAGTVVLALEYQSEAGTLVGTWNGGPLPWGIKNIPKGQIHFIFELPNSLVVNVTTFEKVPTPTLAPASTYYSW